MRTQSWLATLKRVQNEGVCQASYGVFYDDGDLFLKPIDSRF
ncbi:hypothetical protein P8S54_05595 [Thiomicrospira sp. R3]|nr:hypothetical protein [Thiomicrospira sp. R3]WFE67712.1 hypothetical protein P8S54_05595 [Thiomicrospira sp. R3]